MHKNDIYDQSCLVHRRITRVYYMKTSDIRQAFFDYFEARRHTQVPSSSLVPTNDQTLLFTNAGMVQFKDIFLGLEKRPYNRAVTSQCCLRAGGKHNDLENVGYTARHHTFFEMLGNFSFGDYFKREAIQYAWDFLTEVLKLPKERLWVTVYQDDDEAADIWLNEIGIPPSAFSRCGEKDNFWSMGDTGPCGPCSEIFYDHGPSIPGGPPGSPEEDGDRYIEIWNMVFMQYNRDQQGVLHPLPKPSVDTGMGLERIAAVVQGVHNNYHIDSFKHLIKAVAELSSKPIDLEHPSLKVIADHCRACAFLIADGVLPSNEGRGYVLRRIIRRAVRHGNKLGLSKPFFHQLVIPLLAVMGGAYPQLTTNKTLIEETLEREEQQFAVTLAQGLQLLNEHLQTSRFSNIGGDVAFKLYDTYGFPLDLTEDIAREHGVTVDRAGFDACMQQQRQQSQQQNAFRSDYAKALSLSEASNFHGYTRDTMQSKVTLILETGSEIKQLTAPRKGTVILQDTPFYAESGGQAGDHGYLLSEDEGVVFRVDDTQRQGDAILHEGELLEGTIQEGQLLSAQVNVERRAAIRLNHTATHLLHAALKVVVGPQVQQKGSLVEATRARFDFSHTKPLTKEQCIAVETLVNREIRRNEPVITTVMGIEEAKNSGAEALFGEKYADEVRVLSIGKFSKELCGGTHAARTGDIGLFKITSEYGVASGIRRIEMVTGEHAVEWVHQQLEMFHEILSQLRVSPDKASSRMSQLLQEMKQRERTIIELQQSLSSQSARDMLDEIEPIGEVNLLVKELGDVDMQTLRSTLDQLKSSLNSAVIVLLACSQGKLNVIASVSKDILGKVPNAATYVQHLCGKGGGREDMAQGGGLIPDDLHEKICTIRTLIGAMD